MMMLVSGGRVFGEAGKAVATTQAVGKVKAFAWKVTSPTTEVFLLGSIHLASEDVYPLPAEMEKAFEASPVLVVELDATKVKQIEVMKFMMNEGMYKGGDTLEKHVSPEILAAVKAYCEKSGLPLEAASQMKPWSLALTIQVMAMQKMGLDPEKGIDKHFLDKSKGKQVLEAETIDEQLKLLSGFDDKTQAKMLESAVKEGEEMKKLVERMVKAWKSGDARDMEALLTEIYGQDDAGKKVMEKLFDERNPRMAAKVEELLKGDKKAFVIFGAGHMVGKTGVVKLLEKKGYKAEQVEVVRGK
jgi:uncharacterized protein YbaP (TraB family)